MAPSPPSLQDHVQSTSLNSPERFWAHHANQLYWHRKPQSILQNTSKTLPDGTSHRTWSYFPNGLINTTYNCVDRHVHAGHGSDVAIIWDSPVSGRKEKITYAQLMEETEVLAGVMREEGGVGKGDVVLIYMPMIPAALIAMLATARLGAIHAVVFGGFAAASLAQRIDAAKPKVIMTSSCAIEGSKGPLDYRPFVEGAIEKAEHKPGRTIVWQREQKRWDPIVEKQGQRNWQELVKKAKQRGVKAECVPVESNEGIYIIYTSGTTGSPKGVLRPTAGHLVGLSLSIRYLFNITGPGDVMFCASDIGWVVGHSYIVYAPLLAGATTVLFEGKPIGTPDPGSFWRIVEEHKVTTLFTAPTALRAIRKDDPEGKYLRKVGERGGLKRWRALFLAGERSEPSIVNLYQDFLTKYAAKDAMVVDNWWSSESGSPITGIALRPELGLINDKNNPPQNKHTSSSPLKMKPGSAGKPMPGFDVRIVDDSGKELSQGNMGNIVLGIPLAPTGFTTLFNDPVRFYKGYLKRFDGKWIDTGDAGMIDQDGYVHVMSRSDDVINVAAHRFSTGALEQALLSHPSISEACVVSIPDALKGHLPFAFITPTSSSSSSSSSSTLPATPPASLLTSLSALLRREIGPIASLGGAIQGTSIIPRTRSGKTLRRVLRQLLEKGLQAEEAGEEGIEERGVEVPPTIEDREVVGRARERVELWVRERREKRGKAKL